MIKVRDLVKSLSNLDQEKELCIHDNVSFLDIEGIQEIEFQDKNFYVFTYETEDLLIKFENKNRFEYK